MLPLPRPRAIRVLLGVLALVLTMPAKAQEMGLDLSDDTPAALKPSLALLPIRVPAGATAANKAHAEKLNGLLGMAAQRTGWFDRVVIPGAAAEMLGARTGALQSCETAECLLEAARVLATDRVVAAQMTFGAGGPVLKLFGYDPGAGTVDDVAVDGQGKPGFDRAVALAFKPFLERLATAPGSLRVVTNVPMAAVDLPFRNLGTGTVERTVPAGTYRVRVSAPDYLPFEGEVTVESKGKAEVVANLAPKAVAAPLVARADLEPAPTEVRSTSSGKPFYKRPGLYVAVVGLAAAAVGLGFGMSASNVGKRAVDSDNDRIYEVTRAELKKAQSDAMLGNILMAAGGAVTLGGVLWFALEPTTGPGQGKEPGSEPHVVGMVLHVGGEF